MKAFLLALQLVAQDPARPAALPVDSAVRARAEGAIGAFLQDWHDAWRTARLGWVDDVRDPRERGGRFAAAHCHWTQTPWPVKLRLIRGTIRVHASCPMWYPRSLPGVEDERLSVDRALPRAWRSSMTQGRAALRALLDSLALQAPSDMRLTEQRVRFHLEAGAFRDAWLAATSCQAGDPQCMLLQGLVFHAAGRMPQADSTFQAALAAMPESKRCAWSDVGVLLGPAERRAYTAMSCVARAQLEARLWWLSDPLYLEGGNERRAEHFARKVILTLLAPYGDGRQRFELKKGGEAVAETLLRYGWPTQMYWFGPMLDLSHDNWLRAVGADTAAPYLVREYSRDRLHTLPDPAALADPFAARPSDWQLSAADEDNDWWPVEHFARDRGPIRQLPDGQSVLLPRHDGVLLAWAGDLDSKLLARRPGEAVEGTLFASRRPADVRSVAVARASVGRPLVLQALLQPGGVLIGIELPGDTLRPAGRTRFGAVVPSLLAAPYARALSQPLLFDPVFEGKQVPAGAAVMHMYGSTRLPRFFRLGVYWEGYGFGAGDTVSVEIRVLREDRPGILARVGGLVRLGGAGRDSVAMQWMDVPGMPRAIQTVESGVPVQMRNVVLDVSHLRPGRYQLVLSMSGVDSPPRSFELR